MHQNDAKWLLYPSISPDGSAIVFSYHGNLYQVNTDGGNAVAITTGNAYDGYPVWSHDGKSIAFASNRYGNFDVFSIPAQGGTPTENLQLNPDIRVELPFNEFLNGKEPQLQMAVKELLSDVKE